MINKPNTVWQEQIKSLFEKEDKTQIEKFFNILNLILGISEENKDMYNIYKIVGLDNFSKLINVFNGKTIKFNRIVELKESILLALFYYFLEIEGLSWNEIKEKVPFNVNSIKYGIQIKNFNDKLKKQINKLFLGDN